MHTVKRTTRFVINLQTTSQCGSYILLWAFVLIRMLNANYSMDKQLA